MGYVFDFKDTQTFERWVENPRYRLEAERENALMIDMLQPARGETVLEIGCGTGTSLAPLIEMGLSAAGIDASPYMLDASFKKLGHRVSLYRGSAEDLPFDDNSFNHALFMTTLEFVDDPGKAIEEACRVAKDRVFIGVLNRYAIKGIQRRVAGIFYETLFNHARFFGIWELKRLIRAIAGPVPLTWRTVNQFPIGSSRFVQSVEQSRFVQRCPFGTFVGMVVTLVPVFRTRPLALRYDDETVSRHGDRLMPGAASIFTPEEPEMRIAADIRHLCLHAQDNCHGSLPL
ncbi:MAG: class I SAM-dependent methyltransferase [Desulfobacterales bacterium]|jgi:SAM-dependent methyltransferase